MSDVDSTSKPGTSILPPEEPEAPQRPRSLFRHLTGLSRMEKQLLLLLGFAAFFNRYDSSLMSLLLIQIQEGLAMPEASLGFVGSAAHAGSLLAFLALWWADRVGRRQVLLLTISGYTLFTLATALAPNAQAYVAAQVASRLFLNAEFTLSLVVIVEEFTPQNRGWGIGIIGTLTLFGHAFAMLLFGFIQHIPFGWRGMYGLGVLPLLILTYLRRTLSETDRFQRLQAGRGSAARRGWTLPFRKLARRYPGRFLAAAAVTFFWTLSNTPVDFFLPTYMQRVNDWTPSQFSALALLAIGLGMVVQPLAGKLTDRLGRKRVGVPSLALEPLAAVGFYSLVGGPVVAVFLCWAFSSVSNDAVLRTYRSELFPTSARSTAAGTLAIVGTLGSIASLSLEGLLYARFGTHWVPVRLIAASGLAIPALVLFFFPETSGRQLEEIAPEEPESDPG